MPNINQFMCQKRKTLCIRNITLISKYHIYSKMKKTNRK